jgi:hypothetical protein
MERKDVAYVIHTTPKYFYLLPLHLGLIRRYASHIQWDIWIATEKPDDPLIRSMIQIYGVYVHTLEASASGFLDSRAATFPHFVDRYSFVIPVQDDFLLERFVDSETIAESFSMMESDPQIHSMRWMPCPGPAAADETYGKRWKVLDGSRDAYVFTFQLCVWRPRPLADWYTRLAQQFVKDNPRELTSEERRILEIRANYAENRQGQTYFRNWHMSGGEKHLAWIRRHTFPNAVYLSPWPYRPTAVVGGQLEAWAVELAQREGFTIQ